MNAFMSGAPSSRGALAFSHARTSSRNAFSVGLRSKSTSIPYPPSVNQLSGQVSPDGYWMWNGAQWVPNPYRPAAVTQWARPYESARFRATMTSVFLVANAVALALTTGWDVLNIAYLQTRNPDATFTLALGLLALVDVGIAYGTLIPAIVFFSVW